MIKDIRNMSFDELVNLNFSLITETQLGELQEHELVKWCEFCGDSSNYPDHGLWCFILDSNTNGIEDTHIEVYC